jgi:gamma-glutamyl:cysteine ligase YbdK (ATP-grasp superfamily)
MQPPSLTIGIEEECQIIDPRTGELKSYMLIDWFLRDVIDELDTCKEVEYAYTILDQGSSADRQLRSYERSGGDIRAVVEQLVAETREGVV